MTTLTNTGSLDRFLDGALSRRRACAVSAAQSAARPLCVDLDGTLLAGDLLWESLMELLRTRPLVAPRVLAWGLRGPAALKQEIAGRVSLDVSLLPYRPQVLEYLARERASGRKVVLVTAADRRLAEAVASHLGLFDEVMASDGAVNLKGHQKQRALVERFGAAGFDYVGDSPADAPVWQASGHAVVVGAQPRLVKLLEQGRGTHGVIEVPSRSWKHVARAMRPYQWIKNVLVFAPLFTAHQLFEVPKLMTALMAFAVFCLTASAVYVMNDLLDLTADRKHPTKRARPFASGRLGIPAGFLMIGALLGVAFGASLGFLSGRFTLLLLAYLGLSTFYSFCLKRKLLADVICLAGLYTLRILAGAVATQVVVSAWLMAFSMFLFLSLAFVKRYAELKRMSHQGMGPSRRGYAIEDLELVRSVGPSLGALCVLVMCLYVSSPDVQKLYHNPAMLWAVCPFLFYWIMRIWFVAHRGMLHDDPVIFAMKDRNLLISAAIALLIIVLAT